MPADTALTRYEEHPAVVMLEGNAQALVALLPDERAVARFKRVVIQALIKNPDLAKATPASIVNAVIDAATWGLEPSGRHGGAYLVPYRVNVGTKTQPKYETHAQMIPDYRGLIEVITRPGSEVTAIKAYDVREGDEFSYELGLEPRVTHRPSLESDRSAKPLTHAYAWASLRTGERLLEVMDRTWAERIRAKSRWGATGPWATDFDRMALKTAIKLLSNNLPIRPEVRSLLAREDEIEGESREQAAIAAPAAGPTKTARLAARIRQERTPTPIAGDEPPPPGDAVEGQAREVGGAEQLGEAQPSVVDPSQPGPMKGDPCPRHLGERLAGGVKGPADLYHSLGRGQGYCRPFAPQHQ